ncbi:hypothetical protein LZK98_09230 [Sphingomonas cannabina]|uniref:hypothetical protein n=1 Tax=Sphingomonas cannabina TaxID=2899123 RepID=UPI001F37A571|nr:hypothetical protein [Sphingomonas cannabina]UIJ47104.1 hypothetical protein LZK98_09230 [Sphingomonas cannabina]
MKARYSKHYSITGEQLHWLGDLAQELARLVETVCKERIGELEQIASGGMQEDRGDEGGGLVARG